MKPMMMWQVPSFAGCFGLMLTCVVGCSAGNGSGSAVGRGGGGAAASTGGVTGSGAAPTGGSGPTLVFDSGTGTGGADSAGGAESCASDAQQAMTLPLAMYILLDQSGSMTIDANRWDPVSGALKAFVADPSLAEVGVGLQYFPQGATITSDSKICNAANYATADVPVADLPGNAAALSASIDKHYFTKAMGNDAAHWGTPTYPALQGSYTALRAYLTANPARRGVLLLATDGLPSKLCTGDTSAEIVTLIQSQAAMTPPIQTYVIGIGDVGNLNDWATAGGTGHAAFIVDGAGTTTQADLAKALAEIRVLSLPCEYPIPAPDAGMIDPMKVNVQVTLPNQPAKLFPNVAGAAACQATVPAWYYDAPAAPTHIEMCPAACDALHQLGVKINVLFGCATEVYNPR